MSEFAIQGISWLDLESFIAFMISPQKCGWVQKWTGTAINEAFQNTLYQFSFNKLNKLLKDKTFNAVYKHFVESGGLESFINKDNKLKSDAQLYTELAHLFISS